MPPLYWPGFIFIGINSFFIIVPAVLGVWALQHWDESPFLTLLGCAYAGMQVATTLRYTLIEYLNGYRLKTDPLAQILHAMKPRKYL